MSKPEPEQNLDFNLPLPRLRQDLEFHPGPAAPDGSPTLIIHDPLARTFDKAGFAETLILERLREPTTLGRLMSELRRTSLRLSEEEVFNFCFSLSRRGLTMDSLHKPLEQIMEDRRLSRIHPLRWLLHHYLYFRLPLLKPDKFLETWLPRLRFLGSWPLLALYALFGLAGMLMLCERFAEYLTTFPYFFNWQGALIFGLCLTLLKTVHEFTHAFVAKSLGVRVPVMGIAFIVLWPVAFCDVTEAWKIPDHRKRLYISSCGLVTELAIAGIALFFWGVLPPGPWQSTCFALSSTSLGASLLVNLSPAMRFDGYYILMDLWGIDNLQPRSFALARWFYRKHLLGLDAACPENAASPGRQKAMILYSALVFVYRLSVYLAIAVFVYYKFTKILGIILFLVEVWWFILHPFISEAKALYVMRNKLSLNPRSLLCLAGLALGLAYVCLPLPRSLTLPGVVESESSQIIFAPYAGQLADLRLVRGESVRKGEEVASIFSHETSERIVYWELEKKIIEKKYEILSLAETDRAYLAESREELANAAAKLSGFLNQREQSRILAEVDGVVIDLDDSLLNGRYVQKGQVLGRLADLRGKMILAYAGEENVARLTPGQSGVFYPDSPLPPVRAKIKSLSPARSETTPHLALTSLASGPLPVSKDQKDRLVMHESHFLVELEIEPGQDPQAGLGETGILRLETGPISLAGQALRQVWRVILRESGF